MLLNSSAIDNLSSCFEGVKFSKPERLLEVEYLLRTSVTSRCNKPPSKEIRSRDEAVREGFFDSLELTRLPHIYNRAVQKLITALRTLSRDEDVTQEFGRDVGIFFRHKLEALLALGLTSHVVRECLLTLDLEHEQRVLSSKFSGAPRDILIPFRKWYSNSNHGSVGKRLCLPNAVRNYVDNELQEVINKWLVRNDPKFLDAFRDLVYKFENLILNRDEFQFCKRESIYCQLIRELELNSKILKKDARKLINLTLASGDELVSWYRGLSKKNMLPLYAVNYAALQSPSSALHVVKEMMEAKCDLQTLPPDIKFCRDTASKAKAIYLSRKDPISFLRRADSNIKMALSVESLERLSYHIKFLKIFAIRFSTKEQYLDYCHRALDQFDRLPASINSQLFKHDLRYYLNFLCNNPHLRSSDIKNASVTFNKLLKVIKNSNSSKYTEEDIRWAVVVRGKIDLNKAARLLIRMNKVQS